MTQNQFAPLIELLQSEISAVSTSIDAPSSSDGEWWLDLELEGWRTAVSWRADRKFALYVEANGFGERPDELFGEPQLAAVRLIQLMRRHQKRESISAFSLSDIRQLLGESQATVAENLGKDQAEISRLEKRSDAKLSTIDQYVRSLGGRLQVSVVFDQFEGALALADAPAKLRSKSPLRKRRKVGHAA